MPVNLGLASVDDMTIRENMDVFEKNGFGFVEDLDSGMLKLASVPFSKGTTFGPDDIHEMVCFSLSKRCRRVADGSETLHATNYGLRARQTAVKLTQRVHVLDRVGWFADQHDSQWGEHANLCGRQAQVGGSDQVQDTAQQSAGHAGHEGLQRVHHGGHVPQQAADAYHCGEAR